MNRIIFVVLALFAFSGRGAAHGVHLEYHEDFPYVTIKASFTGNQPMKNAEVEIFLTESSQIIQKGTSDPSGRFVFIPEVPGIYRVSVDDGMGHRKRIELAINQSFFGAEAYDQQTDGSISIESEESDHHHDHHDHHHIPFLYKLLFGLSLIFGITGIWYGLRKQKA